jgi:hypothetical protein
LLTTYEGENLCAKNSGLLTSVLADKAYANNELLYDGLHSRMYRVNANVAVKEFKQIVGNYFESNVEKAAKLKGLRNTRMPQPYFARGDVFAMEYVGGVPISSLLERSEKCFTKVRAKFMKSAAFKRMFDNDFDFGGEKFENVLVVMKNGKPSFFYSIDQ